MEFKIGDVVRERYGKMDFVLVGKNEKGLFLIAPALNQDKPILISKAELHRAFIIAPNFIRSSREYFIPNWGVWTKLESEDGLKLIIEDCFIVYKKETGVLVATIPFEHEYLLEELGFELPCIERICVSPEVYNFLLGVKKGKYVVKGKWLKIENALGYFKIRTINGIKSSGKVENLIDDIFCDKRKK
ncbi:MAG: hypothetical protein ACRC6E_14390 [Fusobacteriaceae bacterium]